MKINIREEVRTHRLGKALLQKRGRRPLREVSGEAGVHHATWQRVEQGAEPAMETFKLMMKWLKVAPTDWHEYLDFKVR